MYTNIRTSVKNNRLQILLILVFLIATITFTHALFSSKTVRVGLDNVAVRNGPSLSYSQMGTLNSGKRVTVLKKKNGWLRVRYNDQKLGWIPSWLTNRKFGFKQATKLSEATIVLDPGHGGNDSGALGINQKNEEKTYTLKTAKVVKKSLEDQGARVFLTRSTDTYVGLAARANLSNEKKADAFISFHYDSAPENDSGSGDTTYYYHKETSLKLAEMVNTQLKTKISLNNRGVQFGDFEVTRDNTQPALLIEGGYINTAKDFKQIRTETYRKQVASAVTSGLTNFFSEK
ncbi:N-acetylmuramoyl-L-alanine amidase [Pediococcus inopinatus]|uniref:N-acetylmuramoyl-L-alanine amidase n=1 Tax=Pediococcus inopinatus TaxID=114090 RepID=A0ABZ0Q3K9_9LACO|nr:N-acetylmuramoyl-L-alanine amidase [Pediococcus inopinatus]WPC19054.1 N-acetylmuramoyl-L-alanine amidase [Pediococcus inopinatus]WPC20790.1 N-acetylmuramoyl-L-alanine amidase [Pediococcus inopinatus]WPP10140.1 N-acetylmuramoyl-L-alanine amidase [Pediococcus inopinatus]